MNNVAFERPHYGKSAWTFRLALLVKQKRAIVSVFSIIRVGHKSGSSLSLRFAEKTCCPGMKSLRVKIKGVQQGRSITRLLGSCAKCEFRPGRAVKRKSYFETSHRVGSNLGKKKLKYLL